MMNSDLKVLWNNLETLYHYTQKDERLKDYFQVIIKDMFGLTNAIMFATKNNDPSYFIDLLNRFYVLFQKIIPFEEKLNKPAYSCKSQDITKVIGWLDKIIIFLEEYRQDLVEVEDTFFSSKETKEVDLAEEKEEEKFDFSIDYRKISFYVKLTDQQKQGFKKVLDFLHSRNEQFVVTGYAGTGKTFLLRSVISAIEYLKIKYVVAAPTNKAKKNLIKLGIDDALTISRLLGQIPVFENGKDIFQTNQDVRKPIPTEGVILVDEFSMLNSATYGDLCSEAKAKNTKIIFFGDEAQLPPVGEELSPVLSQLKNKKQIFHLTEIVRYDGHLAKVAEEIRSRPVYNYTLYPFVTSEDKTIQVLEGNLWFKTMLQYFSHDNFLDDSDFVRVLAWRNKTCNVLNRLVRSSIFPNVRNPFVQGDRLIARNPFLRNDGLMDSWDGISIASDEEDWKPVVSTSEEMIVLEDGEMRTMKFLGIKYSYYTFPVLLNDGSELDLRCLEEGEKKKYQDHLNRLKKSCKWEEFSFFRRFFDDASYLYALTTHKSQGSSFDYVFLDSLDMKDAPQKQKLLYTALTRAKKTVFVRKN